MYQEPLGLMDVQILVEIKNSILLWEKRGGLLGLWMSHPMQGQPRGNSCFHGVPKEGQNFFVVDVIPI